VSTTVTINRRLRPPQHFSMTAVSYLKGVCVTAPNIQQVLSITVHMPRSMGRENSLINSLTELKYLMLTLICKVCARTRESSTLFRNLSCNTFLKYRSAHINEMFTFCLLQNRVYAKEFSCHTASRRI
jgi:hypothetical protein